MAGLPAPRPLLFDTPLPGEGSPGWTLVRPRPVGWLATRALSEVWRYRELLYFLAWRDVKVRYKQTALGVAWAILQPLFMMLTFSIFFGRLAGIPSDGVPYPLFALAGLLPWQFFSYALTESSNSVVANQRLVTKVYFPRLVIPLASVLSGLVDFAVSLVLLLLVMLLFGYLPAVTAPLALPFVLLGMLTALGVGLWLAALNVRYRDVRYTLPFLTQIWMLATPLAYPSSLVPEQWRPLLGLNPMAGVVEGFRWALLGSSSAPGPLVGVSALVACALLVSGVWYFRHAERTFADRV